MNFYKSFLVFYKISSILFIQYALAFKMEELFGGYPALQSDFKYQAAIMGKYSGANLSYLLCSAGIISDNLLISAAQCFMHTQNQLKKTTFFAVVGEHTLRIKNIALKELDKIYTYHYGVFRSQHDLAVARLKESLNLQNNVNLVSLKIPLLEETFHGQAGIVAGFGVNIVDDLMKKPHLEVIRLNLRSARLLYYAEVTIIRIGHMDDNFDIICDEDVQYFNNLCGIMSPIEGYERRGVCMGDNGAPLVIGNKVVGVVSKHRKDCDDTIHGTVYTKVSRFKNFIDGLIAGRPINGTAIFDNRPHIWSTTARRRGVTT